MAVLPGPPSGHLSAAGGATPLRSETRAGLLALALAFLGRGAALAPAAAKDPAEAFAAGARDWREQYNRRTSENRLLAVALKDEKAVLGSTAAKYDHAVRLHQTQLKLYRSLAANQKLALQDGVITREVLDKHIARLERMMEERLYYLWGHGLPEDWNGILAKMPKAKRPSFHPIPVSPSQEDWERFRLKDHTPIYEKDEKRMKTVKPEEVGPMEGGAR